MEITKPGIDGQKLRNARVRSGMNLSSAAKFFGVSQATITRWEKGLFKPHPKYYPRIVQFAGGDTSIILYPQSLQ